MGIITKIEDKLGNVVENPFKDKNSLDLLSIEISLKRLMELKRKNILGKVVVPNDLGIIINGKEFEDYEQIWGEFRTILERNLSRWMKEKGYELDGKMGLNLKLGCVENKPFEVYVSYKSANIRDQDSVGEKNQKDADRAAIGQLINIKTGERFKIHPSNFTIGRGEDCAIRINDQAVSRIHALVSYQYGKLVLKDLGSRSGTRVNSEKIKKRNLNHKDRIILGCTELTLFLKCSN